MDKELYINNKWVFLFELEPMPSCMVIVNLNEETKFVVCLMNQRRHQHRWHKHWERVVFSAVADAFDVAVWGAHPPTSKVFVAWLAGQLWEFLSEFEKNLKKFV